MHDFRSYKQVLENVVQFSNYSNNFITPVSLPVLTKPHSLARDNVVVRYKISKKNFFMFSRYSSIIKHSFQLNQIRSLSKFDRKVFNHALKCWRYNKSCTFNKAISSFYRLKLLSKVYSRIKFIKKNTKNKIADTPSKVQTTFTTHMFFVNFEKVLHSSQWTFIGIPLFNSILRKTIKKNYGEKLYDPKLVILDKKNTKIYKNVTRPVKLTKIKNLNSILSALQSNTSSAPSSGDHENQITSAVDSEEDLEEGEKKYKIFLNPIKSIAAQSWLHPDHREEKLWSKPYLFLKKQKLAIPSTMFSPIYFIQLTLFNVKQHIEQRWLSQKKQYNLRITKIQKSNTILTGKASKTHSLKNLTYKTKKIAKKFLKKQKITQLLSTNSVETCLNFYINNFTRRMLKNRNKKVLRDILRVNKKIARKSLINSLKITKTITFTSLLQNKYRQFDYFTMQTTLLLKTLPLYSYYKLAQHREQLQKFNNANSNTWERHHFDELTLSNFKTSFSKHATDYYKNFSKTDRCGKTSLKYFFKKISNLLLVSTRLQRIRKLKTKKKVLAKVANKTKNKIKIKQRTKKQQKQKTIKPLDKTRLQIRRFFTNSVTTENTKTKRYANAYFRILRNSITRMPRKNKTNLKFFKDKSISDSFLKKNHSTTTQLLNVLPNFKTFFKQHQNFLFNWRDWDESVDLQKKLITVKQKLAHNIANLVKPTRRSYLLLTPFYFNRLGRLILKNKYRTRELGALAYQGDGVARPITTNYYFKNYNKHSTSEQISPTYFKTFYSKPLYFGIAVKSTDYPTETSFFLKKNQYFKQLTSVFNFYPRVSNVASVEMTNFESELIERRDDQLEIPGIDSSVFPNATNSNDFALEFDGRQKDETLSTGINSSTIRNANENIDSRSESEDQQNEQSSALDTDILIEPVLNILDGIHKVNNTFEWFKFKTVSKFILTQLVNTEFQNLTENHLLADRPAFHTSSHLTFVLGIYGFYYTVMFGRQHLFDASLLRASWRRVFAFSDPQLLKKYILRKLLAAKYLYVSNDTIHRALSTSGFNFFYAASANFFSSTSQYFYPENTQINHSVNTFDGSALIDKPEPEKSNRIKFKPGYSKLWRRARRDFKIMNFLKFKYQHQVTKYVRKLDFTYSKLSVLQSNVNSNKVFVLLMKIKFATDPFWSRELLDSQSVFINGFVVTNENTMLIRGDFLQLVIYLKFYTILKWQKNLTIIRKSRIYKFARKKFKPKTQRLGADRNYTYPNWLLNLRFFESDVPSFLELDFFTLSCLMIHNPFQVSHTHNYTDIYEYPLVLRLYNWKYIT